MSGPRYAEIKLELLREPDDPSRLDVDQEQLGALADDIAANGLLQPAGVRGPMQDGTYEIGYGHRRYLAHRLLERAEIMCKVFPPDTDLLQIRASENNQREELTPVEQALEIKRFLDRGEPLAAVARRYRKSYAWVQSRIDLLGFKPDLQRAVHDGRLALGVARALNDVTDDGYRSSLIDEAQRTGCTIATAELWRQHWLTDGVRLAKNHHTIEEIAARRSEFVYSVECELCGDLTPFTKTRAFRACDPCLTEVLKLIERAAQEASTGPTA